MEPTGFMSAAVELKSPQHPASEVARRQKDLLTAFFQREAERGGANDPAVLARQLTVVFDGSSAWGVAQARGLDGLALATALVLLDAAGVRLPEHMGGFRTSLEGWKPIGLQWRGH